MTARQVAEELLKHPDMEVLLKVGDDWVEVARVDGTGFHRNALTLHPVFDIGTPGVIVSPPDKD